MEQPITDYVKFLDEAKEAITEMSRMQDQEATLTQRVKQSRKELEAEEKSVADAINQTVKKRTEEINLSYDKELNKGQERLKQARSKREKAKSQGVKERIVEETSELRDENRQLTLQIKTLFQQNHVPHYCKTNWFHALFMPHWFSEYLWLLLGAFLCFLVIPYGLYLMIPNRIPLYLVGIYFLCILLFGGIYIYIGNKTRIRYAQAFKEERIFRDQIHSNVKKIKVITHTIRRDKNEAIYNLQKHDDDIAQMEQELSEIAVKKKDALNTFENVTKNIISDEIAANSREKLAFMKSLLETEEQELRDLTSALKTINLHVTDHYEAYLGKELLQPQRLDELRAMVQEGTYANLSEVLTQYKNKHA